MAIEHLQRIKVFSGDLQVGMFVSELDIDWQESTFLLQGFTLEEQSDIEAVKEQCKFVYVDFKSESQYKKYKLATSSSSTYQQENEDSLEAKENYLAHKLASAASRFDKSSRLMKGLMDRIMLGEDFDFHGVRDAVKENVRQVLANEDAMLMMTLLKSKSGAQAEHSLNVSILSIGFAKFLGYDEDELENIGMGALLHDVGQIRIDEKVLKKEGKLNHNQMAEMCRHPKYSLDLLHGKKELTESCIDIAINHHERLGGQGYPRGLTGDKLSNHVRLVTIVDVFESLTSPQVFRKSMSVVEAYKVLMNGRNSHYDEKLVIKFVQWRGIYPPGSIVEMENGEVGIVIKTNCEFKLKPKVILVLDEYKQPRKERIVDLAKMALDAESKPYKIIKAYENAAFGIDLQSYADHGLKIAMND
jgi:HD-GYP domain-containing protein (c-di-GMP phosphodiesterase class II)